jgi:type IV pilus assembly protein PilC
VNMVRVGELSGTLDTILELSSEQMRKDFELKSRVKGAMMYPAVILLVMLAVGVVVMVYIIPKLTVIFTSMNVELPASTRLLIGISDALTNHGIVVLGIVLVLGYLFRMFSRTLTGIKIFDKLILKLPIFGDISKKINIARFARTTSSLIKGGVSISTALKTVSKTLSNYYYKESIKIAADKIEKGASLKDILEETENLYSPLVLQMIEVGEETGSLDSILMNLAEFYEGEITETTKNLSTIIEPILMVLMGVAVGFFAISMIQPMYSIGDSM